jgi:hypothetical protein
MKSFAALLALISLVCSSTLAAELQPLMTTPGKVIVSEDFAGETIPKTFRPTGPREAFRIVDGGLEIGFVPDQEKSTHGVFATPVHNLSMAFSVKFEKPGSLFIGVDGYKESYKGNTHLTRFALTPERMVWDQKRGGPESKKAVGEAMKAARAAKQPLPKPTPEQLADPNYFRTEELAAKPIDCAVGKWHEVLLEVNGNELVAQVDGQTLVATATENDSMKNRIGIGMTGRATILIDNVRIWENTRRADWDAVKAKLTASGR